MEGVRVADWLAEAATKAETDVEEEAGVAMEVEVEE